MDTAPYFTRSLFPQALLAEPNLATESRARLMRSRRRLTVFSATGGVAALLLITGWHHYYNGNYQSGITVLKQAKAFMDVPPPQGEDDYGNLQLPLLNPVRDATLAYGDWGDRSRLADMGLYGDDVSDLMWNRPICNCWSNVTCPRCLTGWLKR